MTHQLPEIYLTALDEALALESFAAKYEVQGAEFVGAKTVKIPEIVFDGGTAAYDQFATKGTAEINYATYVLDKDRQKAFYFDSVEEEDGANLRTANALREFERTLFVPEVDANFFTKAAAAAGTKATTTLSASNIIDELAKARAVMVNNGCAKADLFMTPTALGYLEKAINRQFAGEGVITDMVGVYNIFDVFMVPDARISTAADFIAIGQGVDAIKHVMKRRVNYMFAPGQHTEGDGYLSQNRWVYGTLAKKNKANAIYSNKG